MMMERLRWLVAVLVAFVLGWVGHAVYGERATTVPSQSDGNLASVASGSSNPLADATGVPVPAGTSSVAPGDQAAAKATIEPAPARHADSFATPGAVDALMQAIETSNRKWLAEFEAEAVDEAWARQAEDEIRRGLSAEPMFGQGRVESILCKSSKCRLVILNERQEATHEHTPDHQAPERAWPTLRAGSTSYERLPGGQPGYRATVFLERRPPAPAPDG